MKNIKQGMPCVRHPLFDVYIFACHAAHSQRDFLQLPADGFFTSGDKAPVYPVCLHKLLVRAALNDPAFVHNDDLIRAADGF